MSSSLMFAKAHIRVYMKLYLLMEMLFLRFQSARKVKEKNSADVLPIL